MMFPKNVIVSDSPVKEKFLFLDTRNYLGLQVAAPLSRRIYRVWHHDTFACHRREIGVAIIRRESTLASVWGLFNLLPVSNIDGWSPTCILDIKIHTYLSGQSIRRDGNYVLNANPSSLIHAKVFYGGLERFIGFFNRRFASRFGSDSLSFQLANRISHSSVDFSRAFGEAVSCIINTVCGDNYVIDLPAGAPVTEIKHNRLTYGAKRDDQGQSYHQSFAMWNAVKNALYKALKCFIGVSLMSIGIASLVYYDDSARPGRRVACGIGFCLIGIMMGIAVGVGSHV